MSRRTYVGLIAAALLLGGIPLIAESRAHVAGNQSASDGNRYNITIVGSMAILLDAATGDNWRLSTNGDAVRWATIPIERLASGVVDTDATADPVPRPAYGGKLLPSRPAISDAPADPTPSASLSPRPLPSDSGDED